MSNIDQKLDRGSEFPYDKMHLDENYSETPTDWARFAALGVIADLMDRRGIKWGFDDIDDDIRAEIVSTMTEIIRRAHERLPPARSAT